LAGLSSEAQEIIMRQLQSAVGTYGNLGDVVKNYAKNIVETKFLPMLPTKEQFNARINEELARGTQLASTLPNQAQFNQMISAQLANGRSMLLNQEEINAKIDEAFASGTSIASMLPSQEEINAKIDEEFAKPITQGTDPLGV